MGIDDRGDRIGRIMKAVDELKPARDQKCDEEEKKGEIVADLPVASISL